MKEPRPLTDESGEVRELLMEDIRRFRPAAEALPKSLLRKLGIPQSATEPHGSDEPLIPETPQTKKKRKSGIPTGNAGEYLVMGELLRRGFDAQLADRNTKGYDVLVSRPDDAAMRKVQVKTVRAQPWYINTGDFKGDFLDRVTIYVLLGPENGDRAPRFFIAKNRSLASHLHRPSGWKEHGFMPMKALEQYENRWEALLS
jgi:hypothetical protein